MIIKRTSFLLFLVYIYYVLISNIFLFLFTGDMTKELYYIGYISSFCFIFFWNVNKKSIGQNLNYGNIFMAILYVFHFGQLIIYTYFQNIYSHIRFLLLLSEEEAVWGFKCMYLMYSIIGIGILSTNLSIKHYKKNKIIKKIDIIKITKIVIFITFPIKVIIDIKCLIVSIINGGANARLWMNSVPNILVYWGKISLIGFALLIILYKTNEKKQKIVFIFIELYILIMMISGIRSENVGYLLMMAFFYISNNMKKIKMKSIFIYIFLVVIILSFIMTVGNFRGMDDKSFSSFLKVLTQTFTEENAMLHLLDNLGDTGYTAQCVINKWLPIYGYSMGNSYYLGLSAIIPNIPGILNFGKITEESCYVLQLQNNNVLVSEYTNIGGSLIGEIFFNFGIMWGIIISVIFGIIVGIISKKINYYMKIEGYYKLIKYIAMTFTFTYWVRSYFGGEIREIIWGPLLYFIVYKIYFQYKIK